MKNKIIRKSNDLVEAQYSMTLWEMRIFIKMLSLLNKDDTDFKQYRIELKDFIKEFELEKNKNAYKLLKDGARSLMAKIVVLSKTLKDGTSELSELPMVIGLAHNIDTNSYIKLSFHPDMKPYLLELQSRFLIYDMRNIIKLPSPYAIRLYELAKQYAKIGNRTISIEKLKKILNLHDKYDRYTHFKKKILQKAKDDIAEHTDIAIDFKEIREGRRVTKIKFIITPKAREEPAVSEKKESNPNQLSILLRKFGVNTATIRKWISKYGEAHILERIQYIQIQDTTTAPINNKAAYLQSILDKDISSKKKQMDQATITKRVNSILFSNPSVEPQIRAKHGEVSQEALEKIVKKMFPDKFTFP